MRLHRFFSRVPLVDTKKGDEFLFRNSDLTYQWRNVLRFTAGGLLVLFDDSGFEWTCQILEIKFSEARLLILDRRECPNITRDTTLCLSVIKKDRFEWVVEKATEIGVKNIIPVLAERSLKMRFDKKRIEKIMIEASEQSGRGTIPKISDAIPVSDFPFSEYDKVVVLHPEGQKTFTDSIKNAERICIFVGPEGGFSDREVKFFNENKLPLVSISPLTLRSETSAIAGLSLCLLNN